MKPNPLSFLWEKWTGVPRPTSSFKGKVVLITGSNNGLGYEAAASFAALDADMVILAVRDVAKGKKARQSIIDRSPSSNVAVWELDMADYSSIQRFATRVGKELRRLDVAILNAGIVSNEYVLGKEGWESMMQVNVMGMALLGLLLLPKLEASIHPDAETPRLIIISSEAHRWLEWDDLPVQLSENGQNLIKAINAPPTPERPWNPLVQNATTKLLAMYISRSLARSATASNGQINTIVMALCPGACKSDLMGDLIGKGLVQTIQLKIFDWIFNKSTEQGGWTYIWASLLGEEAHGQWYKTNALTEPGSLVTSEKGKQLQFQVWNEILDSLKSVPGIR